MSGEDREKRLDELIARAIDSGKLKFDAEKWKQRFPQEFEMLTGQTRTSSTAAKPAVWRRVFKNTMARVAVAACVVLAAMFFIVHQKPEKNTPGQDVAERVVLPAELLTVRSLNLTYRVGGFEAVEKQLAQASRLLGPSSGKIAVWNLMVRNQKGQEYENGYQ